MFEPDLRPTDCHGVRGPIWAYLFNPHPQVCGVDATILLFQVESERREIGL